MVDISSQEKKINIKIQSGGVQANVGVTQDTAQYYSEKAREWAISNRIVDGVDYSSKYYANISKTNALQSAETRELLQSEYKEYSQNLLDIATTEGNNAISAIQTQQTTSVNAVKTEGTTQVNLAKAQATAAANSATQANNVVKQVEDDLDSKVDIDDMVEVDFVDAGSYIAGCAMPSDKYIDLTLGTSEATYTAPANGWYLLVKKNAATGQYVDVSVNGVIRFHCVEPSINDQSYVCFLPVKKGDVLSIKYNLTGTTSYFRFYYAVGSESEAQ